MKQHKLDSKRYLHPYEEKQLYAWLERERAYALAKGYRLKVRDTYIIETFMLTGIRRAELAALTVADAAVKVRGRGTIIVRHGKGDKLRSVMITDAFRDHMREWLQHKANFGESTDPKAPLFVSKRQTFLTPTGVHYIWVDAVKAAGLEKRPGVACHAARHGFGVQHYRANKDIRQLQVQLGHSSPDITAIYASVLEEDVRAGMEHAFRGFYDPESMLPS